MSNTNSNTQSAENKSKAIIAFLTASVPVLGVIFTFLIYLFQKNYLSYFGVNDNWIDIEVSKTIYGIIYKGCIALIVLLPNTISLSPLLFEKSTKDKIKNEVIISLICIILMAVLAYPFMKIIHVTYGKSFLFLLILFSVAVLLPVYFSILNFLISSTIILVIHPIKSFKKTFYYIKRDFRSFKIKKGFEIMAKLVDKINKYPQQSPSVISNDERIKNRNIALYILFIIFVGFMAFVVLFTASLGTTTAKAEKNFRIIKLSESEIYEIPQTSNLDAPYIQNNKKIINSKVVLTENDDYFLIANAYIDETDENINIFIFKNEQMIIEKKDIATQNITVSDETNTYVIN